MLYTKPKNKNKFRKWILRLIQAALILGILFFGYEAINRFTNPEALPQDVNVVIVQPVEVIEVERTVPEPVLDAYDYHRMGLDHHLSNELGEAILDYSRAIGLNEDMSSSWLNRGVAYEQMGNRTNAMFDFMQYIHRDGMSVSIRPAVVKNTEMRLNMYRNLAFIIPIHLDSGDVLNAHVTSVEQDLVDPLIVLTDSEGHPVAANDDARRQDGSLVSMNSYITNYTVKQSGRYTLLVTHAGGGENGIHSGSIDVQIGIDQ